MLNEHSKAYNGDAGYDIYLPHDYVLMPHTTKCINLECQVNLKKGECAIICMRSSWAGRGLVANSAPVDYSYKGDIHLIVHNINDKPISLTRNTAVCQVVIFKIPYTKGIYGKRSKDNKGFGSSERRKLNASKK